MKTPTTATKLTSLALALVPLLLCRGDNRAHDGTTQTSIIKLLLQPEAYDGKRVEFIGYYYSAQELSAAFLTKDAAESGNTELAIWIAPPSQSRTNTVER